MARQARRVPANWSHPKDGNGRHVPLRSGNTFALQERWDMGAANWAEGLWRPSDFSQWIPVDDKYRGLSYEEWTGARPVGAEYMPQWPSEERTHWQMYENTTEGTPIGPVFATPQELARWLADNGALSPTTIGYDECLRTVLDEAELVESSTT